MNFSFSCLAANLRIYVAHVEENSRGSVKRSTFSYLSPSPCFDRGKIWPVAIPLFSHCKDGGKSPRLCLNHDLGMAAGLLINLLHFPSCAELQLANAMCWGWQTLFRTLNGSQAGLVAAHPWICLSSCSCYIHNSYTYFDGDKMFLYSA